LSEELDAQYVVWRIVLETPNNLKEVDSWGLKKVYEVNELLNMKEDFASAHNNYIEQSMKINNK